MQVKIRHWLVSVVLLCAVTIAGCASVQETSLSSPNASAVPATATPATQSANLPGSNLPKLEGKATVVMMVKGSAITIEVDGTNAPITAGNFIDLVNRGVYDGLAFHRVVREPEPFVVQGGDPQSKDPSVSVDSLGTGSFIDPATARPRYIPLEIKPKGSESPVYSKTLQVGSVPVLKHTRGAVAMARSMPTDSASSQFYFALADLSFLDGKYAVFGYVTQGMDVVDKIQCDRTQCDRIESAKVTRGLENLKQGS